MKRAVTFIFDYEEAVMHHARARYVDGVICGHIHAAVIREVGGLVYMNCGDWVDSCTAIVEHADGRMELVDWLAARPLALQHAVAEAPSEPEHDTVPNIPVREDLPEREPLGTPVAGRKAA